MDGQIALTVAITAIVLIVLFKHYQRKKRIEHLMGKYGDAQVVQMIMAKQIWQGMSKGQLFDSWGNPAAADRKIYKTKVAETMKYNQTGKNRYSSRVMLEDDIVVGWKQAGG
ncbi:MAG: DUF2845 domain-containing protein [Phyllobacteriaceae bacterium]|nr:DUF2845 domain-containing protein [Phyllobacteriaceae bacterium]